MRSILLTALFAVCNGAGGEPLTNKQLLSIVPPDAESVVVARLGPLAAEKSAFRAQLLDASKNVGGAPGAARQINTVVNGEIINAKPTAWVCAIREYRAEQGIGMGAFTPSNVFIVEQSTDLLRDRLLKGDGVDNPVKMTEEGGIKFFAGTFPTSADLRPPTSKEAAAGTQDYFVAIADAHTVVTGYRRADVQTIVRLLAKPGDSIPVKWKDVAAGLDIEAPLIILRKYDPHNEDAGSPVSRKVYKDLRADIDSVGLAVKDCEKAVFQIHALTSEPERAQGALQWQVMPEHHVTWAVKNDATGFAGEITWQKHTVDDGMMVLLLMSFFGITVAV
jgi:hypothetical protein